VCGAREARERGRHVRDRAGLAWREGNGGRADCSSTFRKCPSCPAARGRRVPCRSAGCGPMDKASATSVACCSCSSPAQRTNIERKGEGGGAADGCAAASRDIVLGLAPGSGPMDKAAKDYFPCAGAVGCVEREGRSTDVLAAAAVADADGSRSGAAGDGVERAGGCEGGAPRPATSSILTPRPRFF
jgi:hypothetical protein